MSQESSILALIADLYAQVAALQAEVARLEAIAEASKPPAPDDEARKWMAAMS